MTEITSVRDRVLAYVKAHPRCSVGDIAKALGLKVPNVSAALNRLKAEGKVRHETNPYGWSETGLRPSDIATQEMLRAAMKVEFVTPGQLLTAVSAMLPGAAAHERIDELVAGGLLQRRQNGKLTITKDGIAFLPRIQRDAPAMTPYQAPKAPPRRPGSMAFASLPSVHADLEARA